MKLSSGKFAEQKAALYLERQGYQIIDRNWRTRWCEIDIVARNDQGLLFAEVKFRSSNLWGDGLSYVTTKKVKQMYYAAEFWLASHQHAGAVSFAAIALEGDNYDIADFIIL